MPLTVDEVWRDYATDGVPASGVHHPIKSEIRDLLRPLTGGGGGEPGEFPFLTTDQFGGPADPTSIQQAIDALPASGGTIIVSNGTYNITSTIYIGDGTSSTLSTRHGVRLVGEGMPQTQDVGSFTAAANVKINWAGAASGVMIEVRGPIRGVEISQLIFDGAGSANHGVLARSMSNFRMDFLTILNCKQVSCYLTCHSGNNTDQGTVNALNISMGHTAGATGIVCDGPTSGLASTCFVNFYNTRIFYSSTVQNYGIILKVADTVCFYDTLLISRDGVVATHVGVSFDYSGHSTFPGGCAFYTLDPGYNIPAARQIICSGTPDPVNAKPNHLNNLTEVNGGRYPIEGVNLQFDLPKKLATASPSGKHVNVVNADIPVTALTTVQNTGLYRITYYSMISAAGGGGTIRTLLGYNDGVTAQNIYFNPINANTVGAHDSGEAILLVTENTAISYATQRSGTSGTPVYSVFLTCERLY